MIIKRYSIVGSVLGIFAGIMAVAFAFILNIKIGWLSLILVVVAILTISKCIKEMTKSDKEPLRYENDTLSFFKNGEKISIQKKDISEIYSEWYSPDQQAVIKDKNGNKVTIPTKYGGNALSKKLNKILWLEDKV